jgi:hypothetical protein
MFQKIISLILILVYFLLPSMCYADPIELHVSSPTEIIEPSASQQATDCPETTETDNCDTSCCCAGHTPLSAFTKIPYAFLTSKQLSFEPQLALPRLLDRIFVPPQNHS